MRTAVVEAVLVFRRKWWFGPAFWAGVASVFFGWTTTDAVAEWLGDNAVRIEVKTCRQ